MCPGGFPIPVARTTTGLCAGTEGGTGLTHNMQQRHRMAFIGDLPLHYDSATRVETTGATVG